MEATIHSFCQGGIDNQDNLGQLGEVDGVNFGHVSRAMATVLSE